MKRALFLPALLCAGLAQAAAPTTLPTSAAADPLAPSANVTRWADRCTNLTSSGWAFKGPRNFLQWLEVFSDPAIWIEFGRRGLDPQSYVRSLSTFLDPGTPKNFLEWTDPAIYEKWATAAAEPDFYAAVDAILLDPERYMRWAGLPVDARAWNLLATAMNPETRVKWLTAPWHPGTQALIAKALDPNTALNWTRALADPANYPALKATTASTYEGPRGNPYLAVSGIPEQKSF